MFRLLSPAEGCQFAAPLILPFLLPSSPQQTTSPRCTGCCSACNSRPRDRRRRHAGDDPTPSRMACHLGSIRRESCSRG